MIGLIEAGEAGGILSKVLERLAALIEAQSKIKGQITGALIYPVAILVLIEFLLGGGFDDDNNDDQDGGMLIPAYTRSNV